MESHELARLLKNLGVGPIATIKVLRAVCNIDLGEAKMAYDSVCSDVERQQHDALVDEAIAALESLEEDG